MRNRAAIKDTLFDTRLRGGFMYWKGPVERTAHFAFSLFLACLPVLLMSLRAHSASHRIASCTTTSMSTTSQIIWPTTASSQVSSTGVLISYRKNYGSVFRLFLLNWLIYLQTNFSIIIVVHLKKCKHKALFNNINDNSVLFQNLVNLHITAVL